MINERKWWVRYMSQDWKNKKIMKIIRRVITKSMRIVSITLESEDDRILIKVEMKYIIIRCLLVIVIAFHRNLSTIISKHIEILSIHVNIIDNEKYVMTIPYDSTLSTESVPQIVVVISLMILIIIWTSRAIVVTNDISYYDDYQGRVLWWRFHCTLIR